MDGQLIHVRLCTSRCTYVVSCQSLEIMSEDHQRETAEDGAAALDVAVGGAAAGTCETEDAECGTAATSLSSSFPEDTAAAEEREAAVGLVLGLVILFLIVVIAVFAAYRIRKRVRSLLRNEEQTRLLHTLEFSEEIYGVTQLDSELYVLCDKPTEQVEVYDVNSFRLKRRLSVPELRDPTFNSWDLASCEQKRCLYVADSVVECVHRLDLLQGDVTRWSVYDAPYSLSITAAFTVLVTCCNVHKLKEFSTHGDLIRQIHLQPDVKYPNHSVQMTNGQFVVSHGYWSDDLSRVCIVDSDGRTLQTYGGQRGSAAGQLFCPVYLSVDSDQFVFVADSDNRRVLLLSPELKYVRDVVSRDSGLKWPEAIFVDRQQRRLYVADNVGVDADNWDVGRLTVFSL